MDIKYNKTKGQIKFESKGRLVLKEIERSEFENLNKPIDNKIKNFNKIIEKINNNKIKFKLIYKTKKIINILKLGD